MPAATRSAKSTVRGPRFPSSSTARSSGRSRSRTSCRDPRTAPGPIMAEQFRPFINVLADGRSVCVTRTGAIACDLQWREMALYAEDGHHLLDVTSAELSE